MAQWRLGLTAGAFYNHFSITIHDRLSVLRCLGCFRRYHFPVQLPGLAGRQGQPELDPASLSAYLNPEYTKECFGSDLSEDDQAAIQAVAAVWQTWFDAIQKHHKAGYVGVMDETPVFCYIPQELAYTLDRKVLEGYGVTPDIEVAFDAAAWKNGAGLEQRSRPGQPAGPCPPVGPERKLTLLCRTLRSRRRNF